MEPTERTTNTSAGGNGHAEKARRAETTAHDTVDRAARGAHQTVDRLAEKAANAAAQMGEKGEYFNEQKDRVMSQTRTYVQTHPVAAIGIAVAAGFLLSRLLTSDTHDRY